MNAIDWVSDLWESQPLTVGGGILAVGVLGVAALSGGGSSGQFSSTHDGERPTAVATADAFPTPAEATTEVTRVRGRDGTVTTATVRVTAVGADGTPQLVRQVVRETRPGVRVTSVETVPAPRVTVPGAGSTITAPGQDTTVTAPGADVPGPTVTVTVPGPEVTVPGPGETVTVTVPGPTVTETVTATPPAP